MPRLVYLLCDGSIRWMDCNVQRPLQYCKRIFFCIEKSANLNSHTCKRNKRKKRKDLYYRKRKRKKNNIFIHIFSLNISIFKFISLENYWSNNIRFWIDLNRKSHFALQIFIFESTLIFNESKNSGSCASNSYIYSNYN